MEPVRRRFKSWEFSPETEGDVVFENPAADTGAVRLEVLDHVVATLRAVPPRPGAAGEYPTGAGYRVTTPVLDCPGVKAWEFAWFDRVEPEDPTQSPSTVTDVRARLHDGATEFVWDGGAWVAVVDPDADWNTLAEVSTNLPSWDPDTSLGFVFELSTTDRRFTPRLRGFRVVYTIDLPSELDDWIHRTLIADLQSTLRPVKDLKVLSDGTSSIDFGTVVTQLEGGWDFGDVLAAFADQYRRTDILSSYNPTTKIATLSAPPAADTEITLRVEYTPQIAVTTDADYIELAASPAVTFEAIDVVDLGEVPADDAAVNEFVDPPTAVIFKAPRRVNIDVTVGITAPLTSDLFRLTEAVGAWLQARPVIRSHMTGEAVSLRVLDPMDPMAPVPRSGLRADTMRFRLENVYLALRATEEGWGVKQVQVSASVGAGSVDFTIDGG